MTLSTRDASTDFESAIKRYEEYGCKFSCNLYNLGHNIGVWAERMGVTVNITDDVQSLNRMIRYMGELSNAGVVEYLRERAKALYLVVRCYLEKTEGVTFSTRHLGISYLVANAMSAIYSAEGRGDTITSSPEELLRVIYSAILAVGITTRDDMEQNGGFQQAKALFEKALAARTASKAKKGMVND